MLINIKRVLIFSLLLLVLSGCSNETYTIQSIVYGESEGKYATIEKINIEAEAFLNSISVNESEPNDIIPHIDIINEATATLSTGEQVDLSHLPKSELFAIKFGDRYVIEPKTRTATYLINSSVKDKSNTSVTRGTAYKFSDDLKVGEEVRSYNSPIRKGLLSKSINGKEEEIGQIYSEGNGYRTTIRSEISYSQGRKDKKITRTYKINSEGKVE